MLGRHLIRVCGIVFIVMLASLGELTAEAQLLRCRRCKPTCCPSPCKTCCPPPCETCCSTPCATCCSTPSEADSSELSAEPRDAPGLCIQETLYGYPGYWLYYAHFHENGTECPEYAPIIYESAEEYGPMLCYEECIDPRYLKRDELPGLPAPIGASDDLRDYIKGTNTTHLDELAGTVILPTGTQIYARVAMLKIKRKGEEESPKKVYDWVGFGFESTALPPESVGRFHAREVKKHQHISINPANVYEFKVGPTTCFILTAKH